MSVKKIAVTRLVNAKGEKIQVNASDVDAYAEKGFKPEVAANEAPAPAVKASKKTKGE